jgi:uncharacterized damage-inducible protein DinB
MSPVTEEFKTQSIYRIEENLLRVKQCFRHLTDEDIWLRPNEFSNSISNIILHLCGNIRQYIISGLGEQPDTRGRDEEFAARGGFLRNEIMNMLEETIEQSIAIISNMSEESLLKPRQVQGFPLSGIGIIIHVTEHLSYHTGQIAFWVKQFKNMDLGFYSGVNLNIKNQ